MSWRLAFIIINLSNRAFFKSEAHNKISMEPNKESLAQANVVSGSDERNAIGRINEFNKRVPDIAVACIAEGIDQVRADIKNLLPGDVKQVEKFRRAEYSSPGGDVGLARYVESKYGIKSEGKGLANTMAFLGYDVGKTTVSALTTAKEAKDNHEFLLPEIMLDAVNLGLASEPLWQKLVFATKRVTIGGVKLPIIKGADSGPKLITEGASRPKSQISVTTKEGVLRKVGKAITITSEAAAQLTIDHIRIWLSDIGRLWNEAINQEAIDVLINGDRVNDAGKRADPILKVGAAATGKISYDFDLTGANLRMRGVDRAPNMILTNLETAEKILALPEFKAYDAGPPLRRILPDYTLPGSLNVQINGGVPTGDRVIFLDTRSALLRLDTGGITINRAFDGDKDIFTYNLGQYFGFSTRMDDARLMMDFTQLRSTAGYGWPAEYDVAAYQAATKIG